MNVGVTSAVYADWGTPQQRSTRTRVAVDGSNGDTLEGPP